ncbi:MAG: hypothetical protein ACJA2Q_002579 [Pseudohongiellaceae bacterium]
MQFHPEFSKEITQAYILARQTDIYAEGLDARALHDATLDTPESSDILRRFMLIVQAADGSPEGTP